MKAELRFEINIDADSKLQPEQVAAVLQAILQHELANPLRVEMYGKFDVQTVIAR